MKKVEFQRLADKCSHYAINYNDKSSVVTVWICGKYIRLGLLYFAEGEEFEVVIYRAKDYHKSEKEMRCFFDRCKSMNTNKQNK